MKNSLLLILICCLFAVQGLHAQGWERKYTRLSASDFISFTFALPGGYWGVQQLVNKNGNSERQYAIYRTDLDGALLWTKIMPLDTMFTQIPMSAIMTADQNMLVVGNTSKTLNESKHIFLTKINQNGDVLWTRRYYDPAYSFKVDGVVELPDHSLRMAVNRDTSSGGFAETDRELVALDSAGAWLSETNILPVVVGDAPMTGLTRAPDGSLYTLINKNGGYGYVVKMDSVGTVLWTTADNNLGARTLKAPYATADNGIAYFASTDANKSLTHSVVKIDSAGMLQWETGVHQVPSYAGYYNITDMSMGADGSLLPAIGTITNNSTGGVILHRDIARILPDGTIKWNFLKEYTDRIYYFGKMQSTADGGYILGGSLELTQGVDEPTLIKMDSLGGIYTNKINGTVRKDLNNDCVASGIEPSLQRFVLRLIKPGVDTAFTMSSGTGTYSFDADTGTYELAILPPNAYWAACDSSQEITFNGFYQLNIINQPVKVAVNCALPEVDICTPNLRRCDTSQYFVRYSNTGTIPSDSLTVQVVLDPYLSFVNAQLPPASINGDTLLWHFAPLGINGTSTFWIRVLVDCDSTVLGQTHCTSAHIFPDTLCQPPGGWSGAQVEVSITCEGDSLVQATVRNNSTVPTTQAVDFIVLEDDVILTEGSQPLGPFAEITQTFPADGSFFRVEASQEPNYPIPDRPSAFVEGCGGFVSLGFPEFFAQNVGSPFEDIDCTQNSDSYDPNDKQASPRGIKAEHYIHQNEELEYLIRFQNEGTADAKVITIRDTLSSLLDLGSLRPGASSFPYTVEMIGPGVLKFKFNNINLPPKSTNEAASHGFVSFRIRQKKDNPLGSVIYNSAAIYFDYNAPVITNQTWNTIGENFLAVATKDLFQLSRGVHVTPNPVRNTALVQLEHAPGQSFLFELYNVRGEMLLQEGFQGSTYRFSRNNLPDGVCFFRILGPNGWQRGGKMILESVR